MLEQSYRIGAEQEMTVYAKNPDLKRKLPATLTKVFGRIIPDSFKEHLPVSWAKLYNEFVEEGGFPSTHTKFGEGRYESRFEFDDVWIPEGKYYGDGYELIAFGFCGAKSKEKTGHYPEFCTFPTKVRKGFAEEATKAVMAQRARALKVADDGGKLDVSNMHYNISGNGVGSHFHDLPETLAPAYALIMFSNDVKFCRIGRRESRKAGGGIELKAPALMDPEQMEAAYAFLAGTQIGLAKRGPPPVKMKLWEKPLRSDSSEYASEFHFFFGWDYELPCLNKGPKAKLRTTDGKMTALEYFGRVFEFYKEDIREVATGKEMKILEELADGARTFEVEKRPSHLISADDLLQAAGKASLDEIIADYKPTCEAELFSDASTDWRYKKIGNKGLTRTVTKMDWGGITFQFSDGDDSQTGRIPLERMESYMKFEKQLPFCENPLRELSYRLPGSCFD